MPTCHRKSSLKTLLTSTTAMSSWTLGLESVVEEFLENWTESLDVMGTLWLSILGPELSEDWDFCLDLLENLNLDLLGTTDTLVEDPDVCLSILGPLAIDDYYFEAFTDL